MRRQAEEGVGIIQVQTTTSEADIKNLKRMFPKAAIEREAATPPAATR